MRLGRIVCLLAALCGTAGSQTPLTRIQDTLFNADGTRFNGSLTISWSTFDVANAGTVVEQSRVVPVINGNLLVQLVPNATAPPPANIYTVVYQSSGSRQFTENWTVPVSAMPLTVAGVRTAAQSTSGGAGATPVAGANTSPSTIPESDVVGLQTDLAQRPIMGVGFGNNAVAVVDGNGNLETAVGDPGECVFVDGTTGPCGSPTYSDAETPGGTVDGVNNMLTLAYTPLGLSLMLFRNGLYLTPNFDYTLSGSTITFVAGATPQPGDTMTASYRVDTSASGDIGGFDITGGGGNPLHTTAAQVICSATGTSTNAIAWTQLGGCDIPAAGLNPGDRIEVRFGFAHSGTAVGFNFRVNWGSATILTRAGSAQDAAVAGQAEAGVTATGAQVSVQSWGTVLTFLPGISSAPLQQGLKVTFSAALATTGTDSISLTNYTVLRYPAN